MGRLPGWLILLCAIAWPGQGALAGPGPVSSGAAAITPDGATVFVVNPDSGSVSAVDVAARTTVAETAVGPDPVAVALAAGGSRLVVTSRAAGTLAILDPATLSRLATVPVGVEPHGVVGDPRGGPLAYVAASIVDRQASPPRLSGAIRVVNVLKARVVATVHIDPWPTGLAVTASGRRLHVAHVLTGRVSVIDLAARPRAVISPVISTGGESNLARKIVIDPAGQRAYLPHVRSVVSNELPLFDTAVLPVVSVVDLATGSHRAAERLSLVVPETNRAVNLPVDAAFSPSGHQLYVVGQGSGDLAVVDPAQGTVLAHVDAGDGPLGVVLSPDGTRAYVANGISNDLAVIALGSGAPRRLARVPTTVSPLSPRVKRGQRLFFSSRSARISTQRWMSCATCHLDGDHDGRTWLFENGPRNTTSLRGVRDTRPLHWSADRDEVQDFEHTILSLQAGTGLLRGGLPNPPLGEPNAGRSADLDALAAFVNTLAHRTSPFRRADGSLTAAARRGKAIFEDPAVGCARCHPGPRFTDSTMKKPFVRHNVGTGGDPRERLGRAFDTPSLRGLWRSAPYLHHGRAPTLRAVLTTQNRGDRHGVTSHLSEGEIDDLIAYLDSL